MMNATNIIQFNTTEDKNVWNCMTTFLTRTSQNSENTRKTYERAIRDFFLVMRNKELEGLVESDLIFTKSQIETYQVRLKEEFKGTTVNNRMSALKRVYRKLEDYGFDVKSSWFELDRYSEHEKESYDPMTYDEVMETLKIIKNTRKGEEKSLFIELAFTTAFRKESLRNVRMKDFRQYKDEWVIEILGKGNKKDTKKVSDDLYNRIFEFVKMENKTQEDKIFSLTNKTINGMMRYIRENIDFGEKKVTFHSFKKASIEEVALRTGYDLKAMQAQGNHASINTTLDYYMANKKIDDMTVVDINYVPPVEKFEDMSKEELISMLMNAPRDIQVKLLKQEGIK